MARLKRVAVVLGLALLNDRDLSLVLGESERDRRRDSWNLQLVDSARVYHFLRSLLRESTSDAVEESI